MILTANQIIEKGIIFLSEENSKKYDIKLEPAQMGIDLHMISCAKVIDGGFIPKTGKTKIATCEPLEPSINENGVVTWKLEPGDYEIEFAEGCKFPNNAGGSIVHRSSLRRCGAIINSPFWDPGFIAETGMGTFMHVFTPLEIEFASRVAQINIWESSESAPEYCGQYQGKGMLQGNH